jgi:hypothetical protein
MKTIDAWILENGDKFGFMASIQSKYRKTGAATYTIPEHFELLEIAEKAGVVALVDFEKMKWCLSPKFFDFGHMRSLASEEFEKYSSIRKKKAYFKMSSTEEAFIKQKGQPPLPDKYMREYETTGAYWKLTNKGEINKNTHPIMVNPAVLDKMIEHKKPPVSFCVREESESRVLLHMSKNHPKLNLKSKRIVDGFALFTYDY